MPKSSLMPDEGSYSVFLNDVKTRIRSAQISAAISVNQEMTLLYWHIGREILLRQEQQGWGSKVINRLSQDLKREFPDMKGFSRSNLKYMRAFAEAWPDFQIGQQVLANLPWTQNVALLEKLKDPTQRLWYAQQSLENGWGRSILIAQIETGLYQREGGAITNFEHTLPPAQSELAHEVLKDPYKLDFLTLSKDAEAKDLKRALVKHMRDFLLELGVGFSFVGHDYRVTVDNQDFYIDMLFYHIRLRCFVVIQLELGDFQPEHSGKMNFYLSAVDNQERGEYDQPSIGIILCKAKGKTIVDYSLRHLKNPIAVATHKLPSAERLQIELDNAVQMIEGHDEDA
jgi:predicted nuclease of restriction endonuclease-like (RecB) superfamily